LDPSIILGALLGAVMIGFLLFIRLKDLPKPAPVSPFQHLDERKAAIYENLRDLQFEYRLDKLSDSDYQASKLELQKELARVLAEIDAIRGGTAPKVAVAPKPVAAETPAPVAQRYICPSCNAAFEKPLKFCGECGPSTAALRGSRKAEPR
jgi:rRNA maturation endonuclease Nob1